MGSLKALHRGSRTFFMETSPHPLESHRWTAKPGPASLFPGLLPQGGTCDNDKEHLLALQQAGIPLMDHQGADSGLGDMCKHSQGF